MKNPLYDYLSEYLVQEDNLAYWKAMFGPETPDGCRYVPTQLIELTPEEQAKVWAALALLF